MLVRILKRTFGGTEYGPEQRVLRLGGEGSAGVETLEFELPDEWEGMAVTVHVQHLDGTLPTPVLLGTDRCLVVDKTFTASEKGLWMLRALGENGYCALTRPAKYECYETFSAEGDVEITPSQYEAFVAQVREAATRAVDKAKEATDAAGRAAECTENARRAMETAQSAEKNAKESADAARAAAKRAESIAPTDGTVLSVNGKGGAVQLTAEDVGAMPETEAHVRSVTLTGRTLTVVTEDGERHTYTLQDTTDLTKMAGILGTAHGGTGKDTALTAADVGAVASGSAGYIKSLTAQNGKLTVTTGDGKTATLTLMPTATAARLGGVKVGGGLTVGTDGTLALTAADLKGVLGFAPAPVQLPYRIVYDHSYDGTGEVGTESAPVQIPLAGDYDAIAVIRTQTSTYPDREEVTRQRVLLELVTNESTSDSFRGNYVALKGLPAAFTWADQVNSGAIVTANRWNNNSILLRYKDRTLEWYYNIENQPVNIWNVSGYQYHVFGITLDSSILPAAGDHTDLGGSST